MKTVFIYALCEPGTRTVRYIGMTKNRPKRLKQHIAESIRFKTPLGEWLRSLSAPPNMVTLCETPEDFWPDEEALYIRSARSLGMALVNSTDGGDGITMTPKIREKIRASHSTPEAKAAQSALTKSYWANPEYAAKTSAATKAGNSTPEGRANHSKGAKKMWKNPEYLAKVLDTRNTPEWRTKNSENSKARWEDPETRARIIAAIVVSQSQPEVHLKHSASSKAMWATPGYRENRTAARLARKLEKGK